MPKTNRTASDRIKCARAACNVRFAYDYRQPEKQYCSKKCGLMCRSSESRSQGAKTRSLKNAVRRNEAKSRGVTTSQLLGLKLDAYWSKVVDPYYYAEPRKVHPQSSLGGLDA